MNRLILVAATLLLSWASAHAQTVITSCGDSKGKTFALVPNAGWVDDGITGGSLTFLKLADKKLDVIIKDASGSTFSATADGGVVVRLGDSDEAFSVITAYAKGVTETFQLVLDKSGSGKVIWSSLKNGVPNGFALTKGSLFVAACAK